MSEENVQPEQIRGVGTSGSGPQTIVAIGASAGGLKALQGFVKAVPDDSGFGYVIIMHLDPERQSRMAELLQDRSIIPVSQVTERTVVEANHIYVIPPNQDLSFAAGAIEVRDRGERTNHAPVDLFLQTLAEGYGSDAVGIVLSGTGSDGTLGIRSIKERGGITIAQDPAEAEYPGMPTSAIATGQVDLVQTAARIPAELIRLRTMPSPLGESGAASDQETQLSSVFAIMRGKTGHDFTHYKRAMVLRRLERRLRFTGTSTLDEYLPLLRESEGEFSALLRDLLISVSSFFRDPDAFHALAGMVPRLFEGKGPTDSVRVWVVGCATGEEAYSIAILLHEFAATLEAPPRIQVFATDIDETAYSRGRDGLYPASSVAHIPPDRLRRFFTQEGGNYRIIKQVREGVLFAIHNVLRDAPFSRVDLISCRNMLIYLRHEAQAQVLETFHYALRPDGLLFLGKAESAGEVGLFAPAAEAHRLYSRDATQRLILPRLSAADPAHGNGQGTRASGLEDGTAPVFAYGGQHLRMLEAYGPPSLIVDEEFNVVHRSASSGRFLRFGGGEPSHNLMDLSSGDLRLELRTALYRAFGEGRGTSRKLRVDGEGSPLVHIRVEPPVDNGAGVRGVALIVFEEQEEGERLPEPPADVLHRRMIANLALEVRERREQLETTIAAYERTVEELQVTNEEMQSASEEQKAAGEELETSREEIQSMNEELSTINQEHQNTIDELKRTNADLENLIESTDIATIFVDGAMRIRRFTPATIPIFNFVPGDQGRPVDNITHHLDYPELVSDVRGALASLVRLEREVASDSGEWFIVRINPYRSVDGNVDGAIITLFNNTARKLVENELLEAKTAALDAAVLKGTFLATASHEFRTPLNAILAFLELLDLEEPLTPIQQRRVERIKFASLHLSSMIDEILTVAKLESGAMCVESATVDVVEIARQAQELVEASAEAKSLDLVLEAPNEKVTLLTDGAKLRHILVNLCGNAVKYTERGRICLRISQSDVSVLCEVEDTGVGIASEFHERIFDPFWQVDGATTRPGEGMGIGLATVREYAHLLGGRIDVVSTPGEGSTFRVSLPRESA